MYHAALALSNRQVRNKTEHVLLSARIRWMLLSDDSKTESTRKLLFVSMASQSLYRSNRGDSSTWMVEQGQAMINILSYYDGSKARISSSIHYHQPPVPPNKFSAYSHPFKRLIILPHHAIHRVSSDDEGLWLSNAARTLANRGLPLATSCRPFSVSRERTIWARSLGVAPLFRAVTGLLLVVPLKSEIIIHLTLRRSVILCLAGSVLAGNGSSPPDLGLLVDLSLLGSSLSRLLLFGSHCCWRTCCVG